MAYYDALIAKWATLNGTTEQKLAAINALTVAGPAIPLIVPTYAIYNVIVPAEFTALSAANQTRVRDILNLGTVDASVGTQARAFLLSVFGAGTATRTALSALAAAYESPAIPWWQATVAQNGGGLSSPVSNNDLVAAGGLS